jgi:hypothetical protein
VFDRGRGRLADGWMHAHVLINIEDVGHWDAERESIDQSERALHRPREASHC